MSAAISSTNSSSLTGMGIGRWLVITTSDCRSKSNGDGRATDRAPSGRLRRELMKSNVPATRSVALVKIVA